MLHQAGNSPFLFQMVIHDCSVNKVGTLTGKTTAGECPVTLLIKAEGFVDKSIVSTVTVKDEQNATWEGFPEWKQWHQDGETISPGNVANEDGTVEKIFTSSEPSRCLVDENTGVLTVAGEGSCEISLTVSAPGFMTKILKTNIGNLIYDEAKQRPTQSSHYLQPLRGDSHSFHTE